MPCNCCTKHNNIVYSIPGIPLVLFNQLHMLLSGKFRKSRKLYPKEQLILYLCIIWTNHTFKYVSKLFHIGPLMCRKTFVDILDKLDKIAVTGLWFLSREQVDACMPKSFKALGYEKTRAMIGKVKIY